MHFRAFQEGGNSAEILQELPLGVKNSRDITILTVNKIQLDSAACCERVKGFAHILTAYQKQKIVSLCKTVISYRLGNML